VNVKEYISSGVVESYVLGLLTEADKLEFEAHCTQYAEVAEAREAFERSLESTLVSDAIAPPPFLKNRVRDTLFDTGSNTTTTTAAYDEEGAAPVRRMNVWKWVAAASLLLLAGSLYWGISTNTRNRELAHASEENVRLKNELSLLNAQLGEVRQDAAALKQADVKMASLKGTEVSPGSYVTVYWDTSSKDVYLMINNLPQPATDRQYQLWALIDGKPVDLGLLQLKEEKLIPMVKMKGVQAAQAFAITLEPKGGSVNPTMDQMYVIGKL
jgi:anti-sigma-K factor RskA